MSMDNNHSILNFSHFHPRKKLNFLVLKKIITKDTHYNVFLGKLPSVEKVGFSVSRCVHAPWEWDGWTQRRGSQRTLFPSHTSVWGIPLPFAPEECELAFPPVPCSPSATEICFDASLRVIRVTGMTPSPTWI